MTSNTVEIGSSL